jgi:hypothetical protein
MGDEKIKNKKNNPNLHRLKGYSTKKECVLMSIYKGITGSTKFQAISFPSSVHFLIFFLFCLFPFL